MDYYRTTMLYADTLKVARIVQVPMSHFPQTRADYADYFTMMVSG